MAFNVGKALEEIARGDAAALEFMQVFYVFVQTFDDLVDRDKPVTPEEAGSALLRFILVLSQNKFYLAQCGSLLPLITAAMGAWVGSEYFAKRKAVLDHITGQVLKSQYQDIFFHVALLTGGLPHFFAMQQKYRSYYFDSPQPAV